MQGNPENSFKDPGRWPLLAACRPCARWLSYVSAPLITTVHRIDAVAHTRYYDEIANPMDLGTMGAKLAAGEYTCMEDFGKDIELIVANCRQFNPPTTYPAHCADTLEKAFKPLWSKAVVKKLQPSEKKSLQNLMNKLVADPMYVHLTTVWYATADRYCSSFVFREPVDPVLLQIPTYFDVIPRKNARDLRTIRSKLDTDKYDSFDAWEADMDLMIDNALLFNGPDSEVGLIAKQFQEKYKEMFANLRTGSSGKRKGDNAASQPSKKARLA